MRECTPTEVKGSESPACGWRECRAGLASGSAAEGAIRRTDPHPEAIYFVGAMYPVTRAQVWDSGEKLVQVIVGSPFGPEKPGVSKKMVPSS